MTKEEYSHHPNPEEEMERAEAMKEEEPTLPELYCTVCGERLQCKSMETYYHVKSGKPYNHFLWICPNKEWFNNHAKYRTDENGDDYGY